MTLPNFIPSTDPGPSFLGLLHALDRRPGYESEFDQDEVVHGTTIVATKFADGVVIAGDRRATSGNLISYRHMKKVFAADKWSGVGIAGAAGPALEMVQLFQLQLEHYEKVEGRPLSLEGKANQLSQMIRGHLPAAMQGMVVVPLFAGFDLMRDCGRLFAYDITGGRYEEEDYVASGSGSLFAKTTIKLGFKPSATQDAAVDLLIRALFTAADDDSATGGPDNMRGIYPSVSVITSAGYSELEEADIASRFDQVLATYIEGGASK
jgi:proteasome beta subunit